ncbi:BTAD domain-containing putative transcriptional regulator [Fodinicola feengrottensis]|uniref:BTAD domain-containing putative transcriptional regulator n=1 Tax=Fodinicola feengrottensis TaxID=435914 RepID=A0ABP4SPA3_9ACTN
MSVVPTGEALRAARQAAGLTQAMLAQRCGVSVRTIRDLERGRVGSPQVDTSRRLLAALGMTADSRRVRVTILGSFGVQRAGAAVPLVSARQRTLLAYLALHAGHPVSSDRLLEAVWPEHSPAVDQLHQQVSRLRQMLRGQQDVRLERVPTGYQLAAPDGAVDLLDFRARVREARRSDWAYEEWAAAIAVAAGPPLADFPGLRVDPAVQAVSREIAAAVIEFATAARAAGRAGEAVEPLLTIVHEDPLNENLCAAVIRTLAAAGRHATAVDLYGRVRHDLAEELGIDPSPDLQRSYHEVLNAGTDVADGSAVHDPALMRPAQLPADLADFVGRDSELRRIREHLLENSSTAPAIVVISAAGGFGKTALAVHAAQAIRDHFPDGQLFVTLRGASGDPVEAADALGSLLSSLAVREIPVNAQDRARLFCTLTSGRKMLLVLDDATDADQVRALLPGNAGCAVLVSSRRTLAELAGAERVVLPPLAAAEAIDLLARIAGSARIAVEPAAAALLAETCAGLPLAVRVAGGRVASRPAWPLAIFADRLANSTRRLDELRLGNLAVRASLQLSYETLPAVQSWAFRMIGQWPSSELPADFAAALLSRSAAEVDEVLDPLVDLHLLESPTPDMFHIHDLLHLYARELSDRTETDAERESVAVRMMTFAGSTSQHALAVMVPRRVPDRPQDVVHSPLRLTFTDSSAARAWLDRMSSSLFQLIRQIPLTSGVVEPGAHLALLLGRYCHLRGDWLGFERSARRALELAESIGDGRLAARACISLALCLDGLYRSAEAQPLHERALDFFRKTSDQLNELRVLVNIGSSYGRRRRNAEAAGFYQEALTVATALGEQEIQIIALINSGESLNGLDRPVEARAYARRAVNLCDKVGDQGAKAIALGTLGESLTALDDRPAALVALNESLRLAERTGDRKCVAESALRLAAFYRLGCDDAAAVNWAQQALRTYDDDESRYGRARVLMELGQIRAAAGDHSKADLTWRAAADIFSALGAPEADVVADLLATVSGRR